jgi:hypothetical protein
MDWKDIAGKVIGIGAPLIGTALLGPGLGANAGTMVGGILASALGVADSPAAVAQALDTDPQAAAKIQAAQSAHSDDLQAWLASLMDAQNARAQTVALAGLNNPNSKIAWTVPILTVVNVSAFFVTLVGLFVVWLRMPDMVSVAGMAVFGLIQLMIGALIGATSQSNNYWFGTTKSSHDNGVQVRAIANQATAAISGK